MNIPSTLKTVARSALLGSFALGALGTVAALAQEAAPAVAAAAPAAPAFTVDKGDTTWMMISTVLVLLMTIPGLALFYGGLVRTKNMLSVLMQVFTITSVVMIIWVFYGYSLAFTPGNAFVGGLSKMFLSGVNVSTLSETFSKGVASPRNHRRAGRAGGRRVPSDPCPVGVAVGFRFGSYPFSRRGGARQERADAVSSGRLRDSDASGQKWRGVDLCLPPRGGRPWVALVYVEGGAAAVKSGCRGQPGVST